MNLDLLLPLRAVRIHLEFTADSRLRTFHQPALGAWLRTLAEGTLADEPRLSLAAPESGRSAFGRGDRYHFDLFCCHGAEPVLDQLLVRLARWSPKQAGATDRLRLGPNIRFVGAKDFFRQSPAECSADLFTYDAAALAREADFYLPHREVQVRLLSPLRALQDKRSRSGLKGEARFIRDRGQLLGTVFGDRVFDSIASILRAVNGEAMSRSRTLITCAVDDIGWYDVRYFDDEGRGKPMGGVIGLLDLVVEDPAVWPLLVLGQYLGVGQRRTFGWGRYRLEAANAGTLPPRVPSRPLGHRAADASNLEMAFRAMRGHARDRDRGDLGLARDALAWAERPDAVDAMLDELASGLRNHDYVVPALQGAILRQPERKPRPLAVPPFQDRIAQRAVMQILQVDLESLFSVASFGFRRGLSRMSARGRLQSLYRQGYEWLYEADIEDFFDSVSHSRLETRLHSLLTDDPIVDLIMAWMRAPVVYRGERQERLAGLPQGAPLSPLLANLMLEDFDADLQSLGMQLVRFADDFVIACRSRAEAEAAAERVAKSLAEIDLAINPDKTRITRFDDGFRFLGYTFLGGMVVDSPRRGSGTGGSALGLSDLPPASWLALLARRCPRVLDELPHAEVERGQAGPTQPLVADRPRRLADVSVLRDDPCMLLVASEGSRVHTRAGRLRVITPEGQSVEQPWPALGAVLFLGRQQVTTPCLSAALTAGVPMHFATRGGRYLGALSSGEPGPEGYGLWLRQQQLFNDGDFVLPLARELVDARIGNQQQVLRQRARTSPGVQGELDGIARMRERVAAAMSLASLNGVEGAAARHYFAGLARLLPEEFGFEGRRRRPPPDPFNALLSLGYTVLYQRADSVLRCAGLLPVVGVYHRQRDRFPALGADFIEPFRHVVERQALSMINRHELTLSDFTVDGRACRLTRSALTRYLGALSARLLKPMMDSASGIEDTVDGHWWRMARALLSRLRDEHVPFSSFHLK